MARKVFKWTREAEKRLQELYGQGLNISDIAKTLSKEFNFNFTVFSVLKKVEYLKKKKISEYNCEGIVFRRYRFSSDKKVIFLSDFHIGGGAKEERIKKVCDFISKEDAIVFFLGDLLQSETLHSKGSPFGKEPSKDIEHLISLLNPIKEKIVAFISGNHESRVEKLTGINPIRDIICPILNADFFPDAICSYLIFPSVNLTLFALHGNGFARRVGGKLNRLEDLMQIAVADVYVTAHSHLPAYFNLRRVEIESDRVKLKDVHFINCGSFQSYAGYSISKAFVPTGNYFPVLNVSNEVKVEFLKF